MYKYSVPIKIDTTDGEELAKYTKQIRDGKFDRVFLVYGGYPNNENHGLFKNEERSKKIIKHLKDMGVEVGIWLNAFGHGIDPSLVDERHNYQSMVGQDGRTTTGCFCPLDEKYVNDYLKGVEYAASLSPDIIMIDDDFRLNFRALLMGCACPLHMREYSKRIGEEIPREKLEELVYRGGENKYRTAWLKLCGDTMRDFAKKIRVSVDKYSDKIRLGACNCYDTWDICGTDGIEIANIMAGKNKPFLRTISPPYQYHRVAFAVEQTRMQAAWCRGKGIEIFSEGDTFTRHRRRVPSKTMEMYDLALLASGEMDGILKYVYCYDTGIKYETKYIETHIDGAPLRESFAKIFKDKSPVGVRAFEEMHIVEKMHLKEDEPKGVARKIENTFFKRSIRFLSYNSIPTVHHGGKVYVVFGENAYYVKKEDIAMGAVLDCRAAEILKSRGIDTGIEYCEPASFSYETYDNGVQIDVDATLCKMKLSDGAKKLTSLDGGDACGAYSYENKEGARFYVLALDADENGAYENFGHSVHTEEARSSLYLGNYLRQKELTKMLEWIGREPLPAKCQGHPYLYMLASKSEDGQRMSVALFNVFADDISNPEVILDAEYKNITAVNCDARLDRDKVRMTTIPPYGICAFEVTL